MRGKIDKGVKKTFTPHSKRFCVPGHKAEDGGFLKYDVTELEGTDNLQAPSGIILKAQEYASEVFHSRKTFFSVNGSTGGILASILTICKPGSKIIVDRNCHISVINAIIMNHLIPIFVYPKFNNEFGVCGGINPLDIEEAYRKNSTSVGVIVTSPTYFGICSDLWSIAKIAHKFKGILIVDEAHGSHLGLTSSLPTGAIESGADIVIHSAHKTLKSLTQTSLVHICSSRVDCAKFQDCLNMCQTSSPSYLLLASLEKAVIDYEKNGARLIKKTVKECERTVKYLTTFTKIKPITQDLVGSDCIYGVDTTRLVLNLGTDGKEVASRLQNEFNVLVEMASGQNIICVATMGNDTGDYNDLCRSLERIDRSINRKTVYYQDPPKCKMIMIPGIAYNEETEYVLRENSVGRIAAKAIYKNPPCVPILVPGELISQETVNLIEEKMVKVVI